MHPRPRETRDHHTECDDERDRTEKRLQVHEPVRRWPIRVHRTGASCGEHADAERECAHERIVESNDNPRAEVLIESWVALAAALDAECRVGEREASVDEQQRAEQPAEERRPARGERREIQPYDPLRAQPVLLAIRFAVAIDESSARRLNDDASEAEIRLFVRSGGRRRWTIGVLSRSGHGVIGIFGTIGSTIADARPGEWNTVVLAIRMSCSASSPSAFPEFKFRAYRGKLLLVM